MAALKELLDELGGSRGLTLGSILVVCVYVASDHYIQEIEAFKSRTEGRVASLERIAAQYETWRSQGASFTSGERGNDLARRVDRIERRLDQPPVYPNPEEARRIERLERLEDERRNSYPAPNAHGRP